MEPAVIGEPQPVTPEEAAEIAVEIQNLIRAGDERSAWERLRRIHPADIGTIVLALPRTSREALVQVMSPETVAWVLRQMHPLEAGRVASRLGSRVLSVVLDQVNPQQAMETLLHIPQRQAREVAESLEQPLPEPEILTHDPGTAGAIMVAAMPVVDIAATVTEGRTALRELAETRWKFTHIFVVESDGRLAGQVSVVDLAVEGGDRPLRELTWPIPAPVYVETPAAECARLQRHYNLTQLAVVSDEDRLVGVILSEFLLSTVVEEDTRQMLQVASVAGERLDGPLLGAVRTRLPWLTLNLGTTFLAAVTISLFESTLARVVVLATFLPVVSGQGGIGGTQTLTLIVRSIALGELTGVSARRLLAREAVLGLLHGVWLGLLVAAVALLWKQNPGLGMVLGLAMLGNMGVAGMCGAGVPLLLRRIGIDPAVASAVIVTTFTDVLGFLLFLSIASAAIGLIA